MRFENPAWFWLLPLLVMPLMAAWGRPRLAWPGARRANALPPGFSDWRKWLPVWLRIVLAACLIAALARPQTLAGSARARSRGVAIVLALDSSRTMATTPLTGDEASESRFDAAKRWFAQFVSGRPDDLIGLVTFADHPDTACPPTLDRSFLLETLRQLPPAPASEPGTNLGDALAWAISEARASSSPRKVIILISDGQNEPGVPNPLDPIAAARLARDFGIHLHVLGLGPEAGADGVLARMALEAGGTYHQATDEVALKQVFAAIDALERSELTSTLRSRYRDWFPACLMAALGCLLCEPWLRATRWRGVP